MPDEQAFRALTMLVAVCEQTILELERLNDPATEPARTDVERARSRAIELLQLRYGVVTPP